MRSLLLEIMLHGPSLCDSTNVQSVVYVDEFTFGLTSGVLLIENANQCLRRILL
jgi:hypothetical protein